MSNIKKRIEGLEEMIKIRIKPYLYIMQTSEKNYIIKTRKNEIIEFKSIEEIENKFNYKIPEEDIPFYINLIPVNQINKNE